GLRARWRVLHPAGDQAAGGGLPGIRARPRYRAAQRVTGRGSARVRPAGHPGGAPAAVVTAIAARFASKGSGDDSSRRRVSGRAAPRAYRAGGQPTWRANATLKVLAEL